jgi:hypothetical protein
MFHRCSGTVHSIQGPERGRRWYTVIQDPNRNQHTT